MISSQELVRLLQYHCLKKLDWGTQEDEAKVQLFYENKIKINLVSIGVFRTYFGLLRYVKIQQDTAMATATRANKAVMIRAMMRPIIETQMSSTR